MSLFPTFKDSIKVPLQDAAAAAATEVTSQVVSAAATTATTVVSNVSQLVTSVADYATPSMVKKQAEAIVKSATQGIASKFSNITPRKIDISTQNGAVNVIDATTKIPISTVGNVTTESMPTSLTNSVVSSEDKTAAYKVKLSAPYLTGMVTLVLDVMPTIDESRSANYDPVNIIHHPGEILKYRSTTSRGWNISTRLISRNPEEAAKNLKYINIIRSWVMPYHGAGTAAGDEGLKLGAPPPIITLEGYGPEMIGPITCVLESYNWSWPNDVDYINTAGDNYPFPAIITISLTLKEALSPAEYSGFDLVAYREGRLSGENRAFAAISDRSSPPASGNASGTADVNKKSEPTTVDETNTGTSNTYDAFAVQASSQSRIAD